MGNRLIVGVVLALLLAEKLAAQDQNQRQDELGAWEFVQELSLSQAMRNDPNLVAEFAGNYLLVAHPNLISDDNACGQVDVYARNSDGSFAVIQTLAQSDFGMACAQADGFGYSSAYADGVLVIGAPGQLDTALVPGAVLVYAERAVGFEPVTKLSGSSESDNSAWGTRVETDGQILLIQGNELGTQITQQGLASPRTANLFINQPSGWQPVQTISDPETTMFAQDFLITDDWVFINQHTFVRDQECSFGDGVFSGTSSLYATVVTGYQLSRDSGQLQSIAQVEFSNSTPSQAVAPVLDQLINQSIGPDSGQDSEVVTRFLAYGGGLDCGSFNRGLAEILVQYTLDDADGFIQTGRFFVNESLDLLRDEEDQRPDFPTINSLSVDEGLILAIDFNRQGLPFIGINRPFGLLNTQDRLIPTSERLREELLLGRFGHDFFINASLQINASANLAALTSDASGTNRVVVHEQVPALDPAITQAWWFGPAFDGQGVTFEVLSNNRLLMHWFTYDLSGNQMWIRGLGRMVDGEVELQLVRGMGPSFGFNEFDPGDRRVEPWGQATIRFEGCTRGIMRYTSDEFGSGELPLLPLVNNNLDCSTGVLPSSDNATSRDDAPLIAGSFFDPARAGEGIILMPVPSSQEPIVINEMTLFGFATRSRVVAIWLTYTPTGEQAWYYMGVYELCNELPLPTSQICVLQASTPPRNTTGPVFGPEYDPNARISTLWGIASPFQSELPPIERSLTFPSPLVLPVGNPHGIGVLQLEQATLPVGYEPLIEVNQ